MGRILRSLDADAFERKGIHSEHGPITLADLLQQAVDHIPHHALYIDEKRKALQVGERAIPIRLASVGVGCHGALGTGWSEGIPDCAKPVV
jgi:hypothetical protein